MIRFHIFAFTIFLSLPAFAIEPLVAALQNADGKLELIAWNVNSYNGEFTRKGSVLGGDVPGANIEIAAYSKGVVTAVKESQGRLKLIAWEISPGGSITRRGSALAGVANNLAMTNVGKDIVTAVRDKNGMLKLILWDVDDEGVITRLDDALAGAVSDIAVAEYSRGFVTATRGNDGSLKLISWRVGHPRKIHRDHEATAGEANGIDMISLGSFGVVTGFRDSNGNLKLIAWHIGDPIRGKINRRGQVISGEVSKLSIARWSRGVLAAVRDSYGDLKVIRWVIDDNWLHSDGKFYRTGDASAGSIGDVDIMVQRNDARAITAVRQNNGKLKLISWHVGGPSIDRSSDFTGGITSRAVLGEQLIED